MDNNSGGVNTILLVVILVIIVGVGVWYFKVGMAPADNDGSLDVNVQLPEGNEGEGQ